MKRVHMYIALIFTFLFVNLLSINVSRVYASEESIDLSNAYRGEISNYWVLVNYGENYVGEDYLTIFLDPEAINNTKISYIQINEVNEYGEIVTTYFKRGVDSDFGSRFTYNLVRKGYGKRPLTIFLLEDLTNKPTSIIDRINIDDLERIRTIQHLNQDDFKIYQEVEELTIKPYKVYVEIASNSCDYKIKTVRYNYYHTNKDGSETLVEGNAILEESNPSICNRYYFTVSENALYNINIEDIFGYVKPENDYYSIEINNFLEGVIIIIPTYDKSLTRNDVPVYVNVYDSNGEIYPYDKLEEFYYLDLNGDKHDLMNLGLFKATDNGVYTIVCRNIEGDEVSLEVNITNIDREAPSAYASDIISINSSDVENTPYVFNPFSYIIAMDNASSGDNLTIKMRYYRVSEADPSCKIYQGNVLEYDLYRYLYGVNDVCIEYEVIDEAYNSTRVYSKITVTDNTIPTISYNLTKIILEIGDDMPTNEQLITMFGLNIDDNSRLFNPDRVVNISADMSKVDLEELNTYPIYISAIDEAGNKSEEIMLTVIVTVRILVIDAISDQYIVYGDDMIDILYTCNGNPCINDDDAEILPADWSKLSGGLYISSGARYSGIYEINSSLAINSRKYEIKIGNLGNFYIMKRVFKIIANSYSIDYKDQEPVLTWYMDKSVCSNDTKYIDANINRNIAYNYDCEFVSGDTFGGGSYLYNEDEELYAGGIQREEGITVKYDSNKEVLFYKILKGNLKVNEITSGGRENYILDFYGIDYKEYENGNMVLISGYGQFYIYPKHVEVTLKNVSKIYGEDDPFVNYDNESMNLLKEDGKGNIQYEFTCRAYKEPIKSMCNDLLYKELQDEIIMKFNREEGENVGRYKIKGIYLNENYDVEFNEEHQSGAIESAYLTILKRDIEISVDGTNGDGKYTIFYEDALPLVTVSVTSDPSVSYIGLANNDYYNINDLNLLISFKDKLSYGDHPIKYLDSNGKEMNSSNGSFSEYIEGVGKYTITRDTITILNRNDIDVLNNYNLTFIDGELEVKARLIYIKVIDGLTKIYGNSDPSFASDYIENTYGNNTNYLLDGSGHYVLQIINTLENSDIVDDEHYEPFDKNKLVYYMKRSYDSDYFENGDVHKGETVGTYLISTDYFENDSNYIIRIYKEYYFSITTRSIYIQINGGEIEFNYNNILPKFSYSFDNLAFSDKLISQPDVSGFEGNYRNNGMYPVRIGNIKAISDTPLISSIGEYYYINGNKTTVKITDIEDFDISLLDIINGKYYILDLKNNTKIDTNIEASEINMMWNYEFEVGIGFLNVIPREVIIVPNDGHNKKYGDYDSDLTYIVRHQGTQMLEAILDESDFEGSLSREEGEKPGLYKILQNSVTPASKGASYNFEIVGFESNHYFEITKRSLTLKHVLADNDNNITVMYGNSDLASLASGYIIIEGTEAYAPSLCTKEMLNGVEICDTIYDKIAGSVTTYPSNAENVGTYKVINKDLHLERVVNSSIDVSEYYNLTFIEATLTILPRIIYITPSEGQSKIYGENDGEGVCGIKYSYTPHLIKETDVFSGCLKRASKLNSEGNETSEDVGEYEITLGDLMISPNYELVLNSRVMYQINPRNITITAKVMGDNITKSPNLNVYTMTYGDEYELGYDISGMGLAKNEALGINDYIINNVSLDKEYSGVGTYLVVQGKLIINCPRNYNLTYFNAQFNVIKRQVIIEPLAQSKYYGDRDPSEFLFEFISERLPYTGRLERLKGENVGSYKIVIGTLDFGSNYEIVLKEVFFEIKARKVTIIAIDNEKIYGYEDPELSYLVTMEDNSFVIDTPFLGELKREEGEDVGEYKILQHTLALNANYQIDYKEGIFKIYYDELKEIVINSLTNNKYQIVGEESQVALYASFNKGADISNLGLVEWSIVKNSTNVVEFSKDANNIVRFTPLGSPGIYTVTASYLGLSATYEVILRTNNVSSIFISLSSGQPTQILGLETELIYFADVHLYEELEEEIFIEWYVDDTLVCEEKVGSRNECRYTPSLAIGVHTIYAKIGNTKSSNTLDIIINDNAVPRITLVDQDKVYYIEAFQNATENSIKFIEPGYSASDDVDGNITSKVIVTGIEDINYYKVGTYYVIYQVSDKHNHIATNYRTIIVQDTIAPSVKLNASELTEMILEYGSEYIEYGASASDAYDDYYGYPLNVYIDSNLNINRVGKYEIIYFAVDSNGLRGQAIRTVSVIDTIPPSITLIGEENIYLEYKENYKDAGAWFDDNYDGKYRIYASTIIFTPEGEMESSEVSAIDTNYLGIYRLTYYQEDSSGNKPDSPVVRNVIVRDSTPPSIILEGSNPYILRYGNEYIEPGFKVIDNYDGDITSNSELVSVVQVIGNTLGTYYVYYNAKDTHNNIASEVKREVIILDLVSPIIYFTEACPQYMTIEAIIESYDTRCNLPGIGYTVFDDYTPDLEAIQNWVEITGTVDNTTVGVYEINYNVSDRSGNKAITLTRYISVVDTTPPSIELLPDDEGNINFYVEVFSNYVEPGWITSDIYDDYHHLEIQVSVVNSININKLNTYTVTYIAIDSNGNESLPVIREITVRDTVPPVVTLIGEAELFIERGNSYAEFGATAKDNYDDKIDEIIITGAPSGKKLGDFEVSYCASDSSGNVGCAIRLVHVIDTIPPIVLGVEDGKYYRAPLYIYYSPLTGTDEVLTGRLNGELISSPWYVSKEGTYHLQVRDDANNETVIDFVIDMTPPTLYGAKDGEYINHPVTIYSDEKLMNITYKANNGGYITIDEQSITFDKEGQYWVYATDMAGNTSSIISFVIDMTPPAYILEGVLNRGITDTDVTLITENDVIVSVNNQYIPTVYTFTDNGYYKVTIRDLAGNDVFLQFVINKEPSVVISGKTVTFISQNNAIDEFVAKANRNYPKGSGFIYAKPLIDGTFEYISGTLFSDEEYSKLINGEDISFSVPSVGDEEMVVAFIVTLDELNKFTTQTVEGDDDSALIYGIAAIGVGGLIGSFFYFFIIVKRKKDDEEEEEEIIEDDEYY